MRTSSELSGRAKQFYDLMKKFYPSATDNGVAAVVGNFAVESSITPKNEPKVIILAHPSEHLMGAGMMQIG